MIYRIQRGATDGYWNVATEEYVRVPSPLLGAGATSGGMMWDLHLPVPEISNPRVRFWFTERGWNRFGRTVANEGRR